MKRSYPTIIAIILSFFLINACSVTPEKTSAKTTSGIGLVKIVANPEDADVIIDGIKALL